MEQHVIRESLTYTTRQITDDDRALSAEFNDLAFLVLDRARRVMVHGPSSERQVVMRVVLANIAKLSQVDAKAEIETSRDALLKELSKMTAVESAEPEVTPLGVVEAHTHAPLPDPVYRLPVDQDDRS